MTIYISYEIGLPHDGMKGARVSVNTSDKGVAFSEQLVCNSCYHYDTQHSVGDYENNPKLWESFWKFHKRDKPDCIENREVITFMTPLIRQKEKELKEFEDVQY